MSPDNSKLLDTPFTRQVGIEVPIICGAMYPCTNPELVAAVSEAGGIGIIQPISLTYVYRHDFREGLRGIRKITSKPIGMNVLIERSSRAYHDKMVHWLDIALEEALDHEGPTVIEVPIQTWDPPFQIPPQEMNIP